MSILDPKIPELLHQKIEKIENHQSSLSNDLISLDNKTEEKIVFVYTKLGEPYFIKESDKTTHDGISLLRWSASDLRNLAKYIEDHPHLTTMKPD